MHGWAAPFQAQGWPLEADPADPQGVLLKADRLAPLRIRYDGFFFRIERELEGRGTPPHLLAVTEGLPYLKLLRSRQGLKVRAEITVPERIWRVLEALAMLRARWEGQEVRSPAGEAVAPRQLELLLRPWAEARGGRYRAQAGGGGAAGAGALSPGDHRGDAGTPPAIGLLAFPDGTAAGLG
jgi:hypothetical protein